MKRLTLLILILIPTLVKCQVTSNIISESDFYNVKINGVSLNSLKATNGIQTNVSNLIQQPILDSSIQADEDYAYYEFNGFNISFWGDGIGGFEITSNAWVVNIKRITIKVGDHKDVLGSVKLNNQVGGGKSVVYQFCDGCNNFLSIYLDSQNIVTKIVYIEQT